MVGVNIGNNILEMLEGLPEEKGEYIVKTRRDDYRILWFNPTIKEFLDPNNDWSIVYYNEIKGWLKLN